MSGDQSSAMSRRLAVAGGAFVVVTAVAVAAAVFGAWSHASMSGELPPYGATPAEQSLWSAGSIALWVSFAATVLAVALGVVVGSVRRRNRLSSGAALALGAPLVVAVIAFTTWTITLPPLA